MIAFAGVVVHHVENHLNARGVQRLHHFLELAHLAALVAGGAVARHGRKIAQRVVAPVIAQAFVDQISFIDEVMNRQQLNGSDAEILEVLDARWVRQPRIGTAKIFWYIGIAVAESLHVDFVNHRVGKRRLGLVVARPVEWIVDDDGLGNATRAVLLVHFERIAGGKIIREDRRLPVHFAGDSFGVRVHAASWQH